MILCFCILMDTLPIELLIHIFYYLDYPDIQKVIKINKKYADIVENFKKSIPGTHVPYWYWCKERNFIPNDEM